MGQKVNPKSFRLGTTNTWSSKWFSRKNYIQFLKEDILIRDYLSKRLKEALIDRIDIERSSNVLTLIVHATKPGLIIGRAGAGVEVLKNDLQKKVLKRKEKIDINIIEVKKPMLSSHVVMQSMAFDIEKRIPFRRVMKQALSRVMKEGAKGIKIIVSGRLNGVDIARSETLTAGKLPLHTLRADIDYTDGVANTTYGVIGIKVWIYKGDVFNKEKKDK